MQLLTERLILREVRPEDAPLIRQFCLEPPYTKYDPNDTMAQWEFDTIHKWMRDEQNVIPRTYYYLTVVTQDDPETALGSVHLTIQNHSHRQGELGYMFGMAHHNKGYATEAGRALIKFGFGTLKLKRIAAADIVMENAASTRVAEKIGMRQEAHYHETQFFSGRWWDTVTYSITREAWLAQQGFVDTSEIPAAKPE
jgi:RimJ/RimL family protein N-acetyltransferase